MTNEEIGQAGEPSKSEKAKAEHLKHLNLIRNFVKDHFSLSVVVLIAIIIVIILLRLCWISVDTMTLKEIKEHRQKLVDIQKMPDENERMESLRELAKAIGAGTVHTKIVGSTTREMDNGTETIIRQNPISESELIQNINDALQTATMVEMCRVSGNNYIVSIVATLAAFVSASAAWMTIYYKRRFTPPDVMVK